MWLEVCLEINSEKNSKTNVWLELHLETNSKKNSDLCE